jgi:penicillin-binding protein 1C
MEIRALAGSADFHDPSIQGQVDATRARRSPGSTLKPFIYALALEQGLIHPLSLLADAPRGFHDYSPENFDQHFRGPLPARDALAASRNIPAIGLAARLRYPDLYTWLARAGVRFPFSQSHYGLSLVLGGAEMSMIELAGLYALLPNQGLWRPPRLTAGSDLPARLLSPEAAFVTLDMLRDRDLSLRANGARLPVYLKTGTSNGFRDAWTAGVFGPYVLVVWIGNFDNSPNPLFVGRDLAVPLFADIAASLPGRAAWRDPGAAPAPHLNLARIPVCAATGDTDISLCPGQTAETWFIPGASPIAGSKVLRRILIDRASGLRACVDDPATTDAVVREFWPSDLRRIFLRAGIDKPPPPEWMPGCVANGREEGDGPRILTPREGVTYQLRLTDARRNALALTAAAPADARALFWFAGGGYIGSSRPEENLDWTPPPGATELRVVDDKGRSDRMALRVESVE